MVLWLRRMRFECLLLLAASIPLPAAPHRLHVCGGNSKDYVVGAKLPSSGLFRRDAAGWTQLGFNHPQITALAWDPRNSNILYAAAGNGCLRSADGGHSWRITTGWDVTEPRDISLDPNRPGVIYLALPDGIAVSRNEGRSWSRADTGIRRKYTETIEVDRTRSGRVLAGTELGIYLTEDGGASWRAVSDRAAMTLDIEQSPHDPKLWMATTQRAGAWVSRDGGESWTRLEGIGASQTLQNVAFDASDAHNVAIGGWGPGVLLSIDGGRTWLPRNAGLPTARVWRVAFDPDHAGRLYAVVHEDHIYRSDDSGRTWAADGLEGFIATDLEFVPEPASPAVAPKLAAIPAVPIVPRDPGALQGRAFGDRVRRVITAHSILQPGGFTTIAARLWRRRDAAWCSQTLLRLLEDPSGDMFWMFPATAVAYLDRGQLSQEARTALRRAWRTYMPYRGDTENHWLLYYSCLYLMSQLYPNQPGETWYTGKSSEENLREARDYLYHWMDLTLDKGQGEYDCTHYIGVYFLPLSYLAAWSNDAVMREKARMMIEFIMADFAAESLNGIYVGAHARTDDKQVLEKWNGVSSDFAWLLFGQGRPLPGFASYTLYYSIAAAYEPPAIIQRIATGRAANYTHREKKRTRHRWRFFDERNGPVYKTTYMGQGYAVSSDQGGILQPIQQHSWDVTWAAPDPRGVENTLFATHPYSSTFELQTYFNAQVDFITEAVVRSKKTYDSPDKFLGGSPYEQIFQDEDTIVALYDIPPGTRFPHIHAFFSKDLSRLEEDASGWIFAQGGEAFLAYYPLARYEWHKMADGSRELFSPHLKNGCIVQAASAKEFESFDAFKKAILALRLSTTVDPVPAAQFRSLRRHEIKFTYGQAVPRDDWEMFAGPYVNMARGSRVMKLTHGGETRTLDFQSWRIEDSGPGGR